MTVRELITKLGFDVDTYGLKKYDEAVKGTIKTVGLLAAAGAAAIGTLGFAFFRGAGEIEQVEVAFTTMLGSLEKAQTLLGDITRMAEKTPFELMSLVRASKQLLAFGIEGDKVIETMTNLGNISAGIGMNKLTTIVRAFGKIRAKGKASMEELNMMLEAGVPILDEIAKKLDMDVSQALYRMVERGEISFAIVNEAIQNLSTGTGRFADLMIKQSKTFMGLISNIKDVFTNLINSIGKELLPEGKRLALLFLNWITLNKELIKIKVSEFYMKILKGMQSVVEFFDKFKIIGNIGDFLRLIIAIIRVFGDTINRVFMKDGEGVIDFFARWIKENKDLIIQNISNFIIKVSEAFEKVLRVIKEMYPWLLAALGMFIAYKTALSAIKIAAFLTNPMHLAVAAIGLLIGALIYAVINWEEFSVTLKETWTSITSFFKEKKDTLFDWITEPFIKAATRIADIVSTIKKTIKGLVDGTLMEEWRYQLFGDQTNLQIAANAFKRDASRVKGALSAVGSGAKSVLTYDVVGAIRDMDNKLKEIVTGESTPVIAPASTTNIGPTNVKQEVNVELNVTVPEGSMKEYPSIIRKETDVVAEIIMKKIAPTNIWDMEDYP